MNIRCIAVVGAGVMGSDVALHLSCYGHNVVLKDIREEALAGARTKILAGLRGIKMINPELRDLTESAILEKIEFTLSYVPFAHADIIIENVPENWELKKRVYLDLDAQCRADTIIFVNTSCISITKIASLLSHPERVVGVHFMNPVPQKGVVEMIKGYYTSDDTITRAKQFLHSVKKASIVVNDTPGFVVNRLSHLFMNEAAFLVSEHTASPKDIDMLFKKGYGHSMGPLETADLIGIDTVVNSLAILYASHQDPKFRCCPLLQKMMAAGLLGRKSGEGFYKY
jgi:3-hydroxybutyryl-CoA dehydrogenase